MIKRLQTLECLELLVGIEIGLKNERNSVENSTGGKRSGMNCSVGMLVRSTPMTEIFYEFTRLTKLLIYPESTVIPLDEWPLFYRLSYS